MHFLMSLALVVAMPEADDVGPFVRLLWLVQERGTVEASRPASDERVKGVLFKGLAGDGVLGSNEIGDVMSMETFQRLAGDDGRLEPSEVSRALEASIPESRGRLLPRIRSHVESLSTTFDMISEPHRRASEDLARWIAGRYEPGKPLHVTVICTGNTRRSVLASMMGNVAAAYHGMPEIRFHGGGTEPTSINPRTIRALEAIGFEWHPTGREAPRGEARTANPIHRARWGEGLEMLEFSKRYDDPANPQSQFAALLVCGEADAACPFVKGASVRIAMPFLDPKLYDDSAYEANKYDERRDDIGRVLLSSMLQARALRRSAELRDPHPH